MALAVAQATSVSPTGSTAPPNAVDSANLSFGSTTTTGSAIIVATGYFNTTSAQAASEVTDNKSNTYQLAASLGGTGSTEGAGICYNNNGTRGASHQITVNPSGASHSIAINLIEITGQDVTNSTSCFDATTAATANDTTSPFTVTAAAAISGNQIAVYVAGIGGSSGSNAVSEPSGYTRVGSYNDANVGYVFDCAYKLNETGTPAPACTWAGTVGATSPKEIFATFKEAVGAGPGGGRAAKTITYVKEVGFVTNTTAATTSAITVASGGVPVGDLVVVIGSCDNTQSGGGVQTITVTDTRNNQWWTLDPHGIADPGAASAGQEGFIAYSILTQALLASDTITITYANSTAAKAINAQQFSGAIGPLVAYNHTDNETSTPCSVTAQPTGYGQLIVAGTCVEGGTADGITNENDSTDGSWVILTRRGSGTTTSGATLNSGYKIITPAAFPSLQTWNPTLGTARDHCEVIAVFAVNPYYSYRSGWHRHKGRGRVR